LQVKEVSVSFGDLDCQSLPRKSDRRRHPACPASDDQDRALVIESKRLPKPLGQSLGKKQCPGHLVPDRDCVQLGGQIEQGDPCPLVSKKE
jgi:hypothetical protein